MPYQIDAVSAALSHQVVAERDEALKALDDGREAWAFSENEMQNEIIELMKERDEARAGSNRRGVGQVVMSNFRAALMHELGIDGVQYVPSEPTILAAIRELRANVSEDARQLQEARTVRNDLAEQLRQTTAAMRRLQVERDDARKERDADQAECIKLLLLLKKFETDILEYYTK